MDSVGRPMPTLSGLRKNRCDTVHNQYLLKISIGLDSDFDLVHLSEILVGGSPNSVMVVIMMYVASP